MTFLLYIFRFTQLWLPGVSETRRVSLITNSLYESFLSSHWQSRAFFSSLQRPSSQSSTRPSMQPSSQLLCQSSVYPTHWSLPCIPHHDPRFSPRHSRLANPRHNLPFNQRYNPLPNPRNRLLCNDQIVTGVRIRASNCDVNHQHTWGRAWLVAQIKLLIWML